MSRSMRVLVTQAGRSGTLAAALRALGVDVWELPTISIVPPPDVRDADAALRAWDSYDWVVFTSANAVRAVAGRLDALAVLPREMPRLAAVGQAAAAAIGEAGWGPAWAPAEVGGEALAACMAEQTPLEGARVLFPKGNLARRTLPSVLRAAGAVVQEVIVYHTVPADVDGSAVRARLGEERIDAIAFTSPSAVEFFVQSVGEDIWQALPDPVVVASIGPTTSEALQKAGRAPDCIAPRPSMDALAEGIVNAVQEKRSWAIP